MRKNVDATERDGGRQDEDVTDEMARSGNMRKRVQQFSGVHLGRSNEHVRKTGQLTTMTRPS